MVGVLEEKMLSYSRAGPQVKLTGQNRTEYEDDTRRKDRCCYQIKVKMAFQQGKTHQKEGMHKKVNIACEWC